MSLLGNKIESNANDGIKSENFWVHSIKTEELKKYEAKNAYSKDFDDLFSMCLEDVKKHLIKYMLKQIEIVSIDA